MACEIVIVFVFLMIETSALYRSTPHCAYSNQSFEIVCNGESYISSQCSEKIFGDEMEKVRTSVKQLKIVGCKKSILESDNILSYFDGVLELDMSSLGFSTLIPEKISTYKLLKLNASHNDLNKVETRIFEKVPNVTEIDFSYNKIFELRTFAAARNLLMMNFSHNIIFFLHTGVFSQLGVLKLLDLSFNKISTVEKNMFAENQKLEILRLEMNEIYRIDGNILVPMMNSVSVSISCKDIKELDMSSVGQALRVDLKCNGINFWVSRNKTFTCSKEDLKGIYFFNISGNYLGNTHDVIEFLESPIEILDLSHNFLGHLNNTAFDRFKNLRYLYLNHNNLTSLAPDVLIHQDELRILDLSHNFLSKMDFGGKIFSQTHTLRLEFNRLNEMDAVTTETFPSLTSLSITNNQFTCSYLETFRSKWSHLNMVTTCKSEISHEATKNVDVAELSTETIDIFQQTSEAFDIEASRENDDDFQNITDNFEYIEYTNNTETTSTESMPNNSTIDMMGADTIETSTKITETTSDTMRNSTFDQNVETLTEGSRFELENVNENFTTEKNQTHDSKEVASTDFWLQLQIVQFILIVFCILYLVVNVIQRFIGAEKKRNNTCDKEDEFQTIELNSQEFTM